ncbi:MAG: hypothetical protein QXD05_00040 [Candidatus Pacearchaeota archaeon]
MIKDALYLLSKIHVWIATAVMTAFTSGLLIGYKEYTAAIIIIAVCTTTVVVCDIMLKKINENLKV